MKIQVLEQRVESSDRAAAKVVLSLYKEVLGSVPLVSHRLIQLKLTDDPLTSQSPAQLVDFPKKMPPPRTTLGTFRVNQQMKARYLA